MYQCRCWFTLSPHQVKDVFYYYYYLHVIFYLHFFLTTFLLMGKKYFWHVFAFQNCLQWMQRRHKSQYLQEDNVWQKIWDKVRFYWEHIVNTLTTWGTHWEPIGNMMGTKQKNTLGTTKIWKILLSLSLSPPNQKGKKIGSIGQCCNSSLAHQKFLFGTSPILA